MSEAHTPVTSPKPIFQALQGTVGGNYPDYLLDRLLPLLAGQEIVHVESSLTRSGSVGPVTGELVVFTADLVAHERLSGTEEDLRLEVDVTSRRTLTKLAVDGKAVDIQRDYFGERTAIWPYDDQLTAHYSGLPEPLTLPFQGPDSSFIAKWRAFLPSLAADLLRD